MQYRAGKKDGFTLIEIIVSMVLVGIIAAIAGLGIVNGLKGYLLTRESSQAAQKTQLAMARINREFMELTDVLVVDTTQPHVIYDSPNGRRAVAKINNTVTMFLNLAPAQTTLPGTGDILIDNVTDLGLTFSRESGTWSIGNSIDQLTTITIDLTLNHAGTTTGALTFSSTVHPRNTGYERSAPWF